MSVRGSTSRKPLAFLTSLMVLFALAVPFIGTASATHGGTNEGLFVAVQQPAAGTTGACVLVQVNLTQGSGGPVAEAETLDITISQQDTDQAQDVQIGFCDPDTTGPATDLGGADPAAASGAQTGGGAAAAGFDCDDNAPPGPGIESTQQACVGPPFAAGVENPAAVNEHCVTDAGGICRFGVTTSEAGTLNVTAWYEECNPAGAGACNPDGIRQANEPFDQKNVTFSAGGTNAAQNITCTPATDSNPNGTRHEFQCTVTDAAGTPLPGIFVSFDVTAGPNAEEVTPSNCGGPIGSAAPAGGAGGGGTATNNQGQTAPATVDQPGGGVAAPGSATACGYNDDIAGGANSPPGTDTIVAYVNKGATAGGGAPNAGPNAGEPQVTLSKTWTSFARTNDCEPETQNIGAGGTATIVCTVRDDANNPISGVFVTLNQTGGAAIRVINSGGCTPAAAAPGACATTNAAGQATFTVSSRDDTIGTATFRGQIAGGQQAPAPGPGPGGAANTTSHTGNCQNPAGVPAGAPAGSCFDDVNVVIGQSTNTPPPQPQCNDGVDNDGDGLVDFGTASSNDPGCSAISDNTESPNPTGPDAVKVNTAVSAPQKVGNKAKGSVVAGKAKCQKNRKVKVFKANGQSLGSDKTNSAGTYSEGIGNYDGRAYAVAPKKRINRTGKPDLICKKDRSPTVDL